MSETQNNSMHWVIGGALLLVGVLLVAALVFVYSQADSVNTSVGITSVAPTVDSVYISNSENGGSNDYDGDPYTGITLNANSTKTVHVNGIVSDVNGADDISQVSVKFYRSNVSSAEACSTDNNECYSVAECTLGSSDDDSKTYNCQVALQYYADSTSFGGYANGTDWTAYVTVSDDEAQTDTDGTQTVEVGTKLALDIPTEIDYGTLANGESTTADNNVSKTYTQYGNDEADIEVSSSAAMSCTTKGEIPVGSQNWALTDVGQGNENTIALSGSAYDTNLNVGYRTSESDPVSKNLYWNIAVPYDVLGTCTGTTTITAIAH